MLRLTRRELETGPEMATAPALDPTKMEAAHRRNGDYTAVVEQDPETGLYVGCVPGFPGAHSQADTLDELNTNLREVM